VEREAITGKRKKESSSDAPGGFFLAGRKKNQNGQIRKRCLSRRLVGIPVIKKRGSYFAGVWRSVKEGGERLFTNRGETISCRKLGPGEGEVAGCSYHEKEAFAGKKGRAYSISARRNDRKKGERGGKRMTFLLSHKEKRRGSLS